MTRFAVFALFLTSAMAQSVASPTCGRPAYETGVKRAEIGSTVRFTSIGVAEALIDSTDGRKLAADEARLKAKSYLSGSDGISGNNQGELQGARTVEICNLGRKVYVTVSVDTISNKIAAEALSAMKRSIERTGPRE